MGTRSLTHVKDNNQETILTIYRQYDGYPSCMGQDIVNQLKDKILINGYSIPETHINGMESAAAMLISGIMMDNKYTKKTGNFYIYPANSKDCGEEYTYTVYEKDNAIHIKVESYDTVIYDGLLDEVDMVKLENPDA